MATKKPYETYDDAQMDRLFNPPPQADWMDMLVRDIEIDLIEPEPPAFSSWLFWGAYAWLFGCLLGGIGTAVYFLGGF